MKSLKIHRKSIVDLVFEGRNHKPTLLLTVMSLVAFDSFAQSYDNNLTPSRMVHSTAWKIEVMKDGSDCAVITYVPQEYNRTVTPRDDKDLGTFYFVSGKDCSGIFNETFASMPRQFEIKDEYSPLPNSTIVLDSFQNIHAMTINETIGEGATKLYLTYFSSDSKTTDPRDDKFLGMDYVIDSGDPDIIGGPFHFNDIRDDLESDPMLYDLITNNNYYKLREMIINEKLIVEKLRAEKKLKDITPKAPEVNTVKLKK